MLTKSATIILGIIQEHPINAYELIKVLSTFTLKTGTRLRTQAFMQH